MELFFEPFIPERDIDECALLMCQSEPWITLKRDYEKSRIVILNPMAEKFVARINNEFAGFSIIQMQGAFAGYIQTIAIKKEWRGQGVGSKFLQWIEAYIFQQKPNVFINASSFNKNAYRLYQKLGYETIGELKDFIEKGHSEILMRKTISSINDFKPVKQ